MATFYSSNDRCTHGRIYLSATILLGLYGLQQAEVGCAWLSGSRAVWIMEELQLHRLDSDQAPPLSDGGQAPAARRTFWAARGLASFLMTVHQHHRIMSCPMEEVSRRPPYTSPFLGVAAKQYPMRCRSQHAYQVPIEPRT
jgi:hypothetical protein